MFARIQNLLAPLLKGIPNQIHVFPWINKFRRNPCSHVNGIAACVDGETIHVGKQELFATKSKAIRLFVIGHEFGHMLGRRYSPAVAADQSFADLIGIVVLLNLGAPLARSDDLRLWYSKIEAGHRVESYERLVCAVSIPNIPKRRKALEKIIPGFLLIRYKGPLDQFLENIPISDEPCPYLPKLKESP
jgi:hypothetical protein